MYTLKDGVLTIDEGVTEISRKNFSFDKKDIKSVIIPDGVKKIGAFAFTNCENLAKVTIPDSVEMIRDGAFTNCAIDNFESKLLKIKNGCAFSQGGLTLLYRANVNLTDITIPKGIRWIGDRAFRNCSNLIQVTIPESVKSIGDGAFSRCENLKTVTISEGVKKIGRVAFDGCKNLSSVIIPESIKKIESYAFRGCKNLKSIIIPDGVEEIGKDIFDECAIDNLESKLLKIKNGCALSDDGLTVLYRANANLTAITIPEGVKKIERVAFSRCENLTKVTIPDGVEEIGDCAFHCCSIDNLESKVLKIKNGCALSADGLTVLYGTNINLKEVTIPDGVQTIRDYAFKSFENLTSIMIPESVDEIGVAAFQSCSNLTSITISEGVILILNYAFSDCENLTKITIPESVKYIGRCAFSYCANLTTVTMLEGVEKIEDEAFRYCKNLTTIIIPESIKDIGNYSFENCGIDNFEGKNFKIKNGLALSSDGFTVLYRTNSNLKEVTIPEGVQSIKNGAFFRLDIESVTFPKSVREIGWRAFFECKSLKKIFYQGTKKEWKTIKGDGKKHLKGVEIIFKK